MKCRGGLWSASTSQRAADDNNQRLCLLYLQHLPLFPFVSASLYLTSPALSHHSRYLSGSLNMSFLFSFIYFNLHFLSFSPLSGTFGLFILQSIGLSLPLWRLVSPSFPLPVHLSAWHYIYVTFQSSLLSEWVIWHFRKHFFQVCRRKCQYRSRVMKLQAEVS